MNIIGINRWFKGQTDGRSRFTVPDGNEEWKIISKPLGNSLVPGFAGAPGFELVPGNGGLRAPSYDQTTDEEQFVTIDIPMDYKLGIEMIAYLDWCPRTSEGGRVIWGMEYSGYPQGQNKVISADGSSNAGSKIIYAEDWSPNVEGLVREVRMVNNVRLNMPRHTFMIRLFRHASDPRDTLNTDAMALSLLVHYQADTIGGSTETGK